LVVSKQINFSLNKELGYKKDAIVYFPTVWNFFSDKPDSRRFALLEKDKADAGSGESELVKQFTGTPGSIIHHNESGQWEKRS
jgi:hypothetical protein